MLKLVGYCEMKKTEGKVIFLVDETKSGKIVGNAVKTEYLFGDIAKPISPSSIGKEVVISYGRGYNGKAFVASVDIK